LYVLAVFDESNADSNGSKRLAAIAPWYLDRTRVKGNVVRWLGSGEVCTDHPTLVCRSENLDQVASAVAETLTTRLDDWDRIDLSAVDSGNVAIERLLTQLEERECLVSRQSADSCWALELPGTWDDYLASISKSHRKQLRQLDQRVL